MAVSNEFVAFVVDQLSQMGDISVRRMFGGAGLYADGIIFALIADDVAYLKADESNKQDFVRAGSRPFKPYPDKKTTMSYYDIPAEVLEDRVELAQWARRSLSVARKKAAAKK